MSNTILENLNFGFGRKLPMVHQTEAAECGLACIAMVAGFHGQHLNLQDMRHTSGMSSKGARLSDLTQIAQRYHLSHRAVRVELEELSKLAMPCILHWDMNHFVVLKSVRGEQVTIHDPAVGARRLSLDEVSRRFTGIALELTPAPGFEHKAAKPSMKLMEALGKVLGLRKVLTIIFVLALALEVLGISVPFYMQSVVDNALVSGDRSMLATLAIAFSLIILTQVVVGLMRGWSIMSMSTSLLMQGQTNLFTHLQRLPSRYFESRHLADIVSRFGSLGEIQAALTIDLIEGVLDGLLTVVTLTIMFIISPQLTAVVLIGAFLYALLRVILYSPLRAAVLEGIVWDAKQSSHFLETLRGIRTIKLHNGQEKRRNRWLNLLVETINRSLTVQKLELAFGGVDDLLQGLLTLVVIWLGAISVLNGEFTVGMLLAFVAYKVQFQSRISSLIDLSIDLRMLRLHADRLADIAKTEPEDDQPTAHRKLEFATSIELKKLRYRYSPQDAWVLNGIDLRFAPGESVAIIGPSGCGKTTLLKIMASLLEPESGEMLIGGEPIKQFGLYNYRSEIGVVMQDDQLLAGSIADNICFFDNQPDRARIEQCARAVALHDEITATAMGYESLIGDMGTSLSGGQKQRVLLARALYPRPSILLLDEATSHLDVACERVVNQTFRELDITRIIIAHRPETIRSADRMVCLQDGQILFDKPTSDSAGIS